MPSSSSHTTNDFVGKHIVVGNLKLRITRMLAEGGYAIVYIAQDVSTGAEYALKRIFSADETSAASIKEEVAYLRKFRNSPFVINLVSAACEEVPNSKTKEYLILTELCSGIFHVVVVVFVSNCQLNNYQV